MKTLTIPDFTMRALPDAWLEKSVAPLIIEADTDTLEQYERQLKAAADLLEKNPVARVEIEKALRIVDCRKGELFGEAKLGRPSDGNFSSMRNYSDKNEVSRCRKIARHWNEIWPHILKATEESSVTRAAVLRMINNTDAKERKMDAPLKSHYRKAEIVGLHDDGKTNAQIAAELGIGQRQVRHVVEREKIERNVEPIITSEMLSMTARQKLELAIKQHKAKLTAEWRVALTKRIDEILTNTIGPKLKREQESARRVLEKRKGIMDRKTYRLITSCLHPDRVLDETLKPVYARAFDLFRSVKILLLDEKNDPTEFVGIPSTLAQWDVLKRQANEARKTKQTNSSAITK